MDSPLCGTETERAVLMLRCIDVRQTTARSGSVA